MSGSLFIITAASGTGKTSLVKALLTSIDNLKVSISHTTRSPRVGEIDGQHYHFITTDDFKNGIEQGQFLEHAHVFDNYYGTSEQSVKDMLAKGVDVILEIDWQGALQVKKLLPDAVMIFILPPSKTTLSERLCNRATDSKDVINNRLSGAVTEMKNHVNFDYLVINDDFATALAELTAIIISQRLTQAKQSIKHQALISDLLTQ